MSGWYFHTNVMLALAWIAFTLLMKLERDFSLSQDAKVALGRVTLVAALVATCIAAMLPTPRPFDTTASLWPKVVSGSQSPSDADDSNAASVQLQTKNKALNIDLTMLSWMLVGIALLLRLGKLGRDGLKLRRLMAETLLWRRQGQLEIRLTDSVAVPFSLRGLRRAYVVIPTEMAANSIDMRMALGHEGHHHRQGDATWTLALELLTVLFPINPFALLWRRSLSHLQEFACDEALIGRGRFASQAYGHCLIRVTEAALSRRPRLIGTVSMTTERTNSGHTQHLLRRRILMLERYTRAAHTSRRVIVGLGIVASALSVTVAYAAKGVRARQALSIAEVQQLVDGMTVSPEFPVVVNQLVVDRLNVVITDAENCAKTRAAFARMASLQGDIGDAITQYGHPVELLAVPLIESMYRNLPPSASHNSAGIWQFIPQTARNYGLVVSEPVDQRLDIPLETDAAMRLFSANRARFQDWLLALAAYNQGEDAVQSAIQANGTRDAWRLVEAGALNNYITLATAAVILIGNPTLVD